MPTKKQSIKTTKPAASKLSYATAGHKVFTFRELNQRQRKHVIAFLRDEQGADPKLGEDEYVAVHRYPTRYELYKSFAELFRTMDFFSPVPLTAIKIAKVNRRGMQEYEVVRKLRRVSE